ncbi:hypothetical protein LOK49_LG05G02734 [Camellia lanceoleosa]|uniref:Uncharacterized protein n=1 Tax=Camellia lanceoleosa TaxID=1840588 RepID=A0ACC0HI87_9ERIC|nr:hypothetical protein LOK49_LG05G02734 [Camellia lanceoleosa]
MTYKENASPAATEEKVTKVNGTTEKVLELVGNEFIAESHVVDANIDCQCFEATTPHTAHFAPEYQASGTSDKEMSCSELRLSIDNEIQDEVIQSAIVTEAKDNDKSIERDLHVECSKLVTEEENVEFLSEIGFGDPNDCQELVPRSDAGLTETPCKESEVSEEKIMVEFIKSSSKCIDKTNMLKEEENEVALTSFGQLGIRNLMSRSTYTSELEKGTFTDSDEIIYGKEDEDLSDISNKFEVDVPQVNEMKLERNEVGAG